MFTPNLSLCKVSVKFHIWTGACHGNPSQLATFVIAYIVKISSFLQRFGNILQPQPDAVQLMKFSFGGYSDMMTATKGGGQSTLVSLDVTMEHLTPPQSWLESLICLHGECCRHHIKKQKCLDFHTRKREVSTHSIAFIRSGSGQQKILSSKLKREAKFNIYCHL